MVGERPLVGEPETYQLDSPLLLAEAETRLSFPGNLISGYAHDALDS
jgi:hypothetical protein